MKNGKKITLKDKMAAYKVEIKPYVGVKVSASEIWKNPNGKLVALREVQGYYITPDGITYDEPGLVSQGWLKISK